MLPYKLPPLYLVQNILEDFDVYVAFIFKRLQSPLLKRDIRVVMTDHVYGKDWTTNNYISWMKV